MRPTQRIAGRRTATDKKKSCHTRRLWESPLPDSNRRPLTVEGVGVVRTALGDDLQRQIGLYQEATGELA
jgi:hypothetical protein